MQSDEQYVRSQWQDADYDPNLASPVCAGGQFFDSWSAAAAFTHERKHQIAEVEEEEVEELIMNLEGSNVVLQRILQREQQALAELRRGMKEQP